ncbi:MAG: MFS transporter [Acidimicrobiales bacterium]|jgi:MFS family permease
MPESALAAPTPVSRLAVPFLGLLGAIQGSDPNIANTALVGASRGIHMTGSTLALAASVCTLMTAATALSTGLLADRLGRRRVLMAALVLGFVGDLVVALAPATGVYLLGRAIVGVGLGAVYGASFAYIRAVARPGRVPAALGVFTAVIGLSTLVLTFVGGSLASIDWRLAFLVVPVMSVISLAAVPVLLPKEERIVSEHSDNVGQVLLALGIIAFLYGVSQLGKSLTDPKTVLPVVLGAALVGGFFVYESKNEHRFFPVSLFRSPIFLASICAGFVYNFGMAVSFLQVTNLWQYVNGLSTSTVALWQLPLTFTGIIGALAFGRLMSKGMTNRLALVIGSTTTAVGFGFLALLHSSHSLIGFLPGLMIVGAGVTICVIPFGNLVLEVAPAAYFGPVTSSRTTIGQFFYAVGFSMSTVVVDKITVGGVVRRLTRAGVPPTQLSTGLGAVTDYASKSTAPTTSLGKHALAAAVVSYGDGFAVMMVVAAVLCFVAGGAGYVLLSRGRVSPAPPAPPAPAEAPSAPAPPEPATVTAS